MLVAAPPRWDEACFAVPAVRALEHAGLAVGVLCPEAQREFWEAVGGIEVKSFPRKGKAKDAAALLEDGWKASIAWEAGVAAEAFERAGVPRRLGPDDAKLRRRLTHPLEISTGPLDHRVRHYLAMIEALGMDALAAAFFAPADLGVEPQPGAVLLAPDSDFGPSHEWPLDRWIEVAEELRGRGIRLTVAGMQGGRDLGSKLVEKLGGAEFFDATPLAGALPLFAVHPLVIAADGSLPHLAAFAGATCVTLFGPNDPAWRRPLGRRHTIVRRHVECAPCLLPKCPLDLRCQRELETAAVLAAAGNTLDSPPR